MPLGKLTENRLKALKTKASLESNFGDDFGMKIASNGTIILVKVSKKWHLIDLESDDFDDELNWFIRQVQEKS